jgi:Domain of unknown function (DUF4399)
MNRLVLALGIGLLAAFAMAATDKILNFGKGQTETSLTLAPGEHTLGIVFADYLHQSFDPPLQSKKITLTVE